MESTYLSALSVVSAVLISELHLDNFRDYSEPHGLNVLLRGMHSSIYWSNFYCLTSAMLSFYLSIQHGQQRVAVAVPTLFFTLGVACFIVWRNLEVIVQSFAFRFVGESLQDVPSTLHWPNYVAYTLPQLTFTALFALAYRVLLKSNRSPQHPIRITRWIA
tara:strand:- start:4903 stop:5385 length:483 start_codon:yes stop_codon:yes gene_type:complete